MPTIFMMIWKHMILIMTILKLMIMGTAMKTSMIAMMMIRELKKCSFPTTTTKRSVIVIPL